jgi:hypothetical protein
MNSANPAIGSVSPKPQYPNSSRCPVRRDGNEKSRRKSRFRDNVFRSKVELAFLMVARTAARMGLNSPILRHPGNVGERVALYLGFCRRLRWEGHS